MRILCLGNQFLEQDSLAKEIGKVLSNEFSITNIKDSFQLIEEIESEERLVIIDVVENLEEVREIRIEDIRENQIMTAHDFDAGFVLKLLGKKIKIIGMPQKANKDKVLKEVREILRSIAT